MNYYDFFVAMLRKERDMQLLLKGMTSCAQCGLLIDQNQVIVGQRGSKQEHFCSTACRDWWVVSEATNGSLEPAIMDTSFQQLPYTATVCGEV